MKTIDLNCDLGEWKAENGNEKDAAIMPYITSCNIACGGHIGDSESIKSTIRLAMQYHVAIGAHPSYPDKENFGRVVLDMPMNELRCSIVEQLNKFNTLATEEGGIPHHIKPHGALYNEATTNVEVAKTMVTSILEAGQHLPIYCQQGSKLDGVITAAGLTPIYEVFADRAYENDLSLRSRKLEGAIIHLKEEVFEHIHRMVIDGRVKTYFGLIKPIKAHTMCLHSDTKGSIELAKSIHEYLKLQGVTIASV